MHVMIVLTLFWCIVLSVYISRAGAQQCPADRSKEWSYELSFRNGPRHWGDNFPACNGRSQSPINIVTSKLSKAKGGQKLKLIGYEHPITEVNIENDGHTIVITPRDNTRRALQLDKEKYTLQSFHFHWGDGKAEGSEHEINGHKFVMEGHFVHRNNRNEIAVVGVLFEENNKLNAALENILHKKDEYLYEDENFEGPLRKGKIYLGELVDNECPYYRYNGSLTTPPCTENVRWLVCKQSKFVKRSQMKKLFSLYSVRRGTGNLERCHLINNYRPIQQLNGRKVYA